MTTNNAKNITETQIPMQNNASHLQQTSPQAQGNAASRIGNFIWGSGVECSFIPHLNVDQFEWTQHDRFWREDFGGRKRNWA